jgi:hypothetical protein
MISRKTFLKQSGLAVATGLAMGPTTLALQGCARNRGGSPAPRVRHVTVAAREGRFLGWPANNGLWSWDGGRELLVGFSEGDYVLQDGHNVGREPDSNLARSLDGGRSWTIEEPRNYVGSGIPPVSSPGGIDFTHRGFALRVAATGYHGTDDPDGHFHVSTDRGRTWSVPYRFNGLNEASELQGLEITARTNYRVRGPSTCLVMMSARNPELEFARRLDKALVAITEDGGRTFRFLSWIVPWSDDFRAVMPSVVETPEGHLVAALRRRDPRRDAHPCWIDAYSSTDYGRSWRFLSRVGETGLRNGNPPALTALRDGRLACCYANRSTEQILMRYSLDRGRTWEEEHPIRTDPLEYDIGYPQLIQNADGELVAMYYLADQERPVSFIEAAVWKP